MPRPKGSKNKKKAKSCPLPPPVNKKKRRIIVESEEEEEESLSILEEQTLPVSQKSLPNQQEEMLAQAQKKC